jgi:hypothetical protein
VATIEEYRPMEIAPQGFYLQWRNEIVLHMLRKLAMVRAASEAARAAVELFR